MFSAEESDERNSLPIIYTCGTYYEVGFDVGRTFRGLIQDYLGSSSWLRETMLPAYETKAGKDAYNDTLALVNRDFPHYVKELQGTADGAKVPFLHLMLLNMDRIISTAGKATEKEWVSGDKGCSDYIINFEDKVLLGHNQDAHKEMEKNLYIVAATILEDKPWGKLGTSQECFMALCYPGHLPGICMGYSIHGLVYSVNLPLPLKVFPAKTPRHFLCRALMTAKSVEGAHAIMRDHGTGAADGFIVNMVYVAKDGSHTFQNVEVGPAAGDADESPLSVVTHSVGQHYFHANRYLHLTGVPEHERAKRVSERREARARYYDDPKGLATMLDLLTDRRDPDFPIFVDYPKEDGYKTLALGIVDIIKRKWRMWAKNPGRADSILEVPLDFDYGF